MSKKDDTNLDESKNDYNNKNDNATTSTSSVSDSVNNEQTLATTSDSDSKNEDPTTESSIGSTTNNSFDFGNNHNDTIASEPYVQDGIYSNSNQANRRLTGNYFCFDCGAIMTTLEDKNQHHLIEEERHKKQEDSEH
jgi:hypothetical protein